MKEYQSLALALDNMNDSLPLYVKSPRGRYQPAGGRHGWRGKQGQGSGGAHALGVSLGKVGKACVK